MSLGGSAAAQSWIELAPLGGPPDPNVFLPRIAYDSTSNRLIVFRPGNPAVGGLGNQVWILTNANGLGGTPAWIQLAPGGTAPAINWGASIVYDRASNSLIVFGGCFANCGFPLDGVFVLTNANGLGGTPIWSQSTVTNPFTRSNHTAVYDSANNLMIAFGGQLGFFDSSQNDTRLLDNANGVASPSTWTGVSTSGGPPGPRNDHTAVHDATGNRMIVYAGAQLICCNLISDYDDVWVLTDANGLGTPTWQLQTPSGSLPPARRHHSAVYDSLNNRMLVFGGTQVDFPSQTETTLADLWELSDANGLGTSTWTQLSQSGAPPGPRSTHSAAFDVANQRMILFGGRDQSGAPSSRVWVLVFEELSLLLIDEDSIDNGIESVEDISFSSPFCGGVVGGPGNPSVCVNDDIANLGVRTPLFTRDHDVTPFSGLVLPTGQVGDDGLFRFTKPDPQVSLQNGAVFTTAELIASAGAAADENNLDKIDGVAPLSAADIFALEGKTVCAVVYDSDVGVTSVDPPAASLKGATLGLTAFKVTAVNPNPAGGSYLPLISVDLFASADVQSICESVAPVN